MQPRATAIIQARMTSTRLPGKVLMKVLGRPLLSYEIERLRFSRNIAEIAVATTTNQADDPIVALAQRENLKVYRGSENDVLDRYYQAAREFGVEHILRITADCPLIEPTVCDRIIKVYADSGADYVHTGERFAEGFDCGILSFKTLSQAWRDASLKSEREHVTLYTKSHPERFHIISVVHDTDDSKYRVTVDEPEDFLAVKAIIENLYVQGEYITAEGIKSFVDNHPEIYRLNADIIRNEGLLHSLQADLET
jgi:spore coat polysaccharide biosynthesis protein SpsF